MPARVSACAGGVSSATAGGGAGALVVVRFVLGVEACEVAHPFGIEVEPNVLPVGEAGDFGEKLGKLGAGRFSSFEAAFDLLGQGLKAVHCGRRHTPNITETTHPSTTPPAKNRVFPLPFSCLPPH